MRKRGVKGGLQGADEEQRRGWTSLAVQRLRLPASNAGGVGSIPGRGTKIPHATQPNNFFF